jgi:hypothetical protein
MAVIAVERFPGAGRTLRTRASRGFRQRPTTSTTGTGFTLQDSSLLDRNRLNPL